MKRTTKWVVWSVVAIVLIALLAWWVWALQQPGKLDPFAACLKDKGAVFYGAFWCPHCKNQKSLFGKSVKYLPYVECSTPDGQDQTQTCKDKGVSTYPTWIFADNSRLTGEISLKTLAEKTGCALP